MDFEVEAACLQSVTYRSEARTGTVHGHNVAGVMSLGKTAQLGHHIAALDDHGQFEERFVDEQNPFEADPPLGEQGLVPHPNCGS